MKRKNRMLIELSDRLFLHGDMITEAFIAERPHLWKDEQFDVLTSEQKEELEIAFEEVSKKLKEVCFAELC